MARHIGHHVTERLRDKLRVAILGIKLRVAILGITN